MYYPTINSYAYLNWFDLVRSFPTLANTISRNSLLTYKNRASYIQDRRIATLQMLHFIYIFFSTNIRTKYFKHAAHSPFFSLQNAVYFIMLPLLVPVSVTFYVQSELKYECKTPVPKG
jgi:hypothetical protein